MSRGKLSLIIGIFILLIVVILALVYQTRDSSSGTTHPSGFRNVIDDAGIGNVGILGQTAAWGDFDSDGCQDLFVANTDWGTPPNAFLFKNNCNGSFSNVIAGSGIKDMVYRSAAWADFDNDGLLDIVLGTVTAGAPPILYKNLGKGTFGDVSEAAELTKVGCTVFHAIWGDYDNDALVDLFLACGGESFLYHNDGGGKFSEVSKESGVEYKSKRNRAALWFDSNNNGLQDLFLASEGPNTLYSNKGDGKFVDFSVEAGIGGDGKWRSVSVCAGDYDNDGFLDLYVGNIGSSRNALYKNMKDGTFKDVTVETGTSDIGDARTCAWVDYDGDGWLDIYAANHANPSKLFRNLGNGKFTDIAVQAGIDTPIDVFGASWGDYDNDGDLDGFLTGHIGNALMKNETNSNNSLVVTLTGDGKLTNRSAIGSKVEVHSSGLSQIRYVNGGRGQSEQDMLPVHFGLGRNNMADVMVRWPSGNECKFKGINIEGVKRLKISEKGCEIN